MKLPNLTKNDSLSNFDFHGQPFKYDIFCVTAFENSRISTVSSSYPAEQGKFAIAVTPNTSDLEGRPWRLKLLRMLF